MHQLQETLRAKRTTAKATILNLKAELSNLRGSIELPLGAGSRGAIDGKLIDAG